MQGYWRESSESAAGAVLKSFKDFSNLLYKKAIKLHFEVISNQLPKRSTIRPIRHQDTIDHENRVFGDFSAPKYSETFK